MDKFKSFNKEKKFSILHLNIASLLSKLAEVNEIIDLRLFDLISFNETKIDANSPDPFNSIYYNVIRRDRNGSGGGVMIFIRKEYKIIKQIISDHFELIYFQLEVDGLASNFICAYNPHVEYSKDFFDHLENNFIMNLDLTFNLFIIGDLNNDLLNQNGTHLSRFMHRYELINNSSDPTRTVTKFYTKTETYKTSSTLIDVILSNKLIPYDSFVFDCPFSDHCFIAAIYNLGYEEIEEEFIWRRNLSIARMKKIRLRLLDLSFGHLEYLISPEEFWMSLKSDFLNVLNSISPLEKVKKDEKGQNIFRRKRSFDLYYRHSSQVLNQTLYKHLSNNL